MAAVLSRLIAVVLLLWSGGASASYVQMPAPKGWTQTLGGAVVAPKGLVEGGSFASPAAGGGFWVEKRAAGQVVWNSALGSVKMPLAVEAASTLGSAAAALWVGNPAVGLALTAASIALPLGLQYVATQGWMLPPDSSMQSDGYVWQIFKDSSVNAQVSPNVDQAAQKWCAWLTANPTDGQRQWLTCSPVAGSLNPGAERYSANVTFSDAGGPPQSGLLNLTARHIQDGSCPVGWWYTASGGCVKTPEYTKQSNDQAASILKGVALGDALLNALPQEAPVPVKSPPKLNPDAGGNPQPLNVPQGAPVPNPKYDPGQPESKANPKQVQPTVTVTPSGTPDRPFQVDVRPDNVPVLTGETPSADPYTPPSDGSKDGTPDDVPDVCKLHPDISGCAELGQPDDGPDLQTKDLGGAVTPVGAFGPDSGACPQPIPLALKDGTQYLSWQPMCDVATGLRPFILGIAWLGAAFIFLGFGRGSEA